MLATIIDVSKRGSINITEAWLQDTIKQYLQDDVFRSEFLQLVAFHGAKVGQVDLVPEAKTFLHSLGTERISFLDPERHDQGLLPGPYVVLEDAFREVWKLYEDSYETLLLTLQPGLQKYA